MAFNLDIWMDEYSSSGRPPVLARLAAAGACRLGCETQTQASVSQQIVLTCF
jgi:hypothetical protein